MHRFRFLTVMACIMAAYAMLLLNIYNLQIKKGDYYAARAQSQYRLAGFLEPHRGNIYFTDKDDNAIPVAINKTYPAIFAVPREIEDLDKAIENISPLLNIEQGQLRADLSKNNFYELLVKKATDEQVLKVGEANIKGIYVDDQDWRYYPYNNLAAHALGFVGPSSEDNQLAGRYGMEKHLNSRLSGQPGLVENKKITKPVQGSDIYLTIDRNIQAETEKILKDLVKQYSAASGSAIVQEPVTGKILAISHTPDFDPNNYSEYPIASFINPIAQAIYEPGSVFKILTMAAALDSGKITPETTYQDPGILKFTDGRTIRNWDLKAHGLITMGSIIEQSINTGAAFVESKLGHKDFYQYIKSFGFEEPTGIDLPGELSGNLKNIEKYKSDFDFAAASFGQGVAITPIQLVGAVSAIANKGRLMKPIIGKDDASVLVRQVISEKAAKETTAMMVSAVDKAKVAHIPNYKIAGKTGTAQVPDFKKGGYTDQVINTYVGFGPASDPKFTILIKLDKPDGAPLAGQTVVPAFRKLAEFIISYYGIPPDNLVAE